MSSFISTPETCYADMVAALGEDAPVFISRIGGSDTKALVNWRRVHGLPPRQMERQLERHLDMFVPMVSEMNGFYDFGDPRASYARFVRELEENYRSSRILTLSNRQYMSIYFPEQTVKHRFQEEFPNKEHYISLMEDLLARRPDLRCYPYRFIESLVKGPFTMLRAFQPTLAGKKVLVVSPMTDSIVANFANRQKFFKDYEYPEFEIDFVTVPITYSGLAREFYPHDDWFQTQDALIKAVSEKDFDVALLSCGTYAMGIGVHIEKVLRRKAVYMGGVMQLFFGVTGRRYEHTGVLRQINREHFITPLEAAKYTAQLVTTEDAPREAFGAYF